MLRNEAVNRSAYNIEYFRRFGEESYRNESTWERIRNGNSNEKNLIEKLLIAHHVVPGLLCSARCCVML